MVAICRLRPRARLWGTTSPTTLLQVLQGADGEQDSAVPYRSLDRPLDLLEGAASVDHVQRLQQDEARTYLHALRVYNFYRPVDHPGRRHRRVVGPAQLP